MRMLAFFLAFAKTALFAVNADLVLKPRDTEAVVGDSTYFDCASDVNRNEVNWVRYSVGAKDHEDICIYCMRKIHPLYEKRIQVERDISKGKSRLRIKSVQLEDAGRYLCQDNGGIGESASAQLLVLESSPTCASNIKPVGLIGPNSCNIELDELHLSCTVSYNGNIPPMIQWRDIRTVDSVDKGFSCQNTGNRMTCSLTMNTDLGMNGASFICETKRSATTQYNCTSDVIRIIYAKTNNSPKEAIRGLGEKVICSANSSETCSYLWKWFNGEGEEVVSNNSVFSPLKIGWHKCEANCNIRDKQCMLLSSLILVLEAKTKSDLDGCTRSFVTGLTIAAPLSLLFCIFGCCSWSLYSRSRKKQRSLTDNSKTDTDEAEMTRLN